jgi:hypothetical protein
MGRGEKSSALPNNFGFSPKGAEMIGFHVTSDRRKMLICSMTDDHLLNTIRMACRQIKTMTTCEKVETKDPAVLAYMRQNKIKQRLRDEDRVLEFTRSLFPYIAEATLRGIMITDLLQDTFQRKQFVSAQTLICYDEEVTDVEY